MRLVFNCLKCFCLASLLYCGTIAEQKTWANDRVENFESTIRDLDNTSRFCRQDLPAAIEKTINRPKLARSRWGIEIQTLTGESLYSLNGDQFFTPASSVKLLTSAAVLLELGKDYRIKTSVYRVGDVPNLTS